MEKLCVTSILLIVSVMLNHNGIGVAENVKERSFIIDYEHNTFSMDGKPFRYIAGSLHYFRVPHQYWRDRLRKLKAAGLNAVDTYVEWSLHNPVENVYNWEGDANLEEFIKLAEEEGLYVILRPGPYICAERDFGGQPGWLLIGNPPEYNFKPRSTNPRYMFEVERWMKVLFGKISQYLYGNGGPIIMVQIENEYGALGPDDCDNEYKNDLFDIFYDGVGDKAVLFTTDGYWDDMPKCGKIRGAYATVDFGHSDEPEKAWEVQRKVEPSGPLVNSEYYTGWLTHWGEEHANVAASNVASTLRKILAQNASLSFYMFAGGTNFGLTNGANHDGKKYEPQITSYDYDAPLTEAGDPTAKYMAIREVIGEFLPLPDMQVPTISTKGDYGRYALRPLFSLFNEENSLKGLGDDSIKPYTFEDMWESSGFMIYETRLTETKEANLTVADIRDRALVYVNETYIGTLDRNSSITSIQLNAEKGSILAIIVENQGRINYGKNTEESKGLIAPVEWGQVELKEWYNTPVPLKEQPQEEKPLDLGNRITEGNLVNGPIVYSTTFDLPRGLTGIIRDTFLDMSGWGKGVVWINGHNLGRYWPAVGPQKTLYVPGVYLNHEKNKMYILELEAAPKDLSVTFTKEHKLNSKNGSRKNAMSSLAMMVLSWLSLLIIN